MKFNSFFGTKVKAGLAFVFLTRPGFLLLHSFIHSCVSIPVHIVSELNNLVISVSLSSFHNLISLFLALCKGKHF